ncbi:MAG: substrate-binding domain-containing protein [Lachnospiraceae bacterium]|nr:substrate-binding domain-containing protein [Lachnospiraceae bacterium]
MKSGRKRYSRGIIRATLLAFFFTGILVFSQTKVSFGDNRKPSQKVVDFDRTLDPYVPKKKQYNFYFTYRNVHPWWDAIAMGIEDAQNQYIEKGIKITYEYMAPAIPSVRDQKTRLLAAAEGDYDVIGVDVTDEKAISPILDRLVDEGHRVMTFSSSDAATGCKRVAYVGNTHNYEDGRELTEALCKKLNYSGEVAILVGIKGAPCHEDRARGARDVLAKYPNMKIKAIEYDQDNIWIAKKMTRDILEKNENLSGIICCNMSNPVGAARAVIDSGRDITIVGMDHDREALHYLEDGIIYCLGVQDCYSIGFDTLQVAVMIADGLDPGSTYPEKTEEETSIIYQEDADHMLEMLYGEM